MVPEVKSNVPTQKHLWSIAILVVLCAAVGLAFIRQKSIDNATREWADLGGGIYDMEVYLLGPGAVFLKIDKPSAAHVSELNNVAKVLFSTCSPNLDIFWKGSLEMQHHPGTDEDLETLLEILKGTKVRNMRFISINASEESIVRLCKSLPNLRELKLPSNRISPEKAESYNRLIGKNVVTTFPMPGTNQH